jgi:hypothetical protein
LINVNKKVLVLSIIGSEFCRNIIGLTPDHFIDLVERIEQIEPIKRGEKIKIFCFI